MLTKISQLRGVKKGMVAVLGTEVRKQAIRVLVLWWI